VTVPKIGETPFKERILCFLFFYSFFTIEISKANIGCSCNWVALLLVGSRVTSIRGDEDSIILTLTDVQLFSRNSWNEVTICTLTHLKCIRLVSVRSSFRAFKSHPI